MMGERCSNENDPAIMQTINEDFTWTNGSGIRQYKHTPYVINERNP